MLGKKPAFADTYREKLIAHSSSGPAELMGCEDRIMYLISEVACLENLKLEKIDEVQSRAHINRLSELLAYRLMRILSDLKCAQISYCIEVKVPRHFLFLWLFRYGRTHIEQLRLYDLTRLALGGQS